MEDFTDGIFSQLVRFIASLTKFLWEVASEYILWPTGWCFWRIVTLGAFPKEGIWGPDDATLSIQLTVELTGLVLQALIIYLAANLMA